MMITTTLVDLLDAPNKPGTWLVIRYLQGEPEEVHLQSVLMSDNTLRTRAYVSLNQDVCFFPEAVKVEEYNRSDFKWLLLQEELTEYLKKQLL